MVEGRPYLALVCGSGRTVLISTDEQSRVGVVEQKPLPTCAEPVTQLHVGPGESYSVDYGILSVRAGGVEVRPQPPWACLVDVVEQPNRAVTITIQALEPPAEGAS